MKRLAIYSIIVLSMQMLFNCKKYPEGGCEKRGPRNIIGNWKLTLYEVNGIDSTNLINYNGNEDYKSVVFSKNASTISASNYQYNYSSSFFDNNEKIRFSFNDSSGIKCIFFNNINYCFRSVFVPEASLNMTTSEWTIDELTKKEIKLSSNQKNIYRIKLSK